MAISQVITDLPPAPQRSQPADFVVKADAHVASLTGFVDETNIVVDEINTTQGEINTTQDEVNTSKDDSAVSAAESSGYAADSANSALTAQSVANGKGNWADLTGALNVPASAHHKGIDWQLLIDLADVTTSEPSITADWSIIDNSARMTHNRYLHFYRNR